MQVAFTGSTEVGKLIMAQAAKNLVPVTLELGGDAETFVLDPAVRDKNMLLHAGTGEWQSSH